MIPELPVPPVPKWIPDSQTLGVLPVHDLLDGSVYYPACGFDGKPVEYLAGNFHSFVYVDYGVERDQSIDQLRTFRGYHVLAHRDVRREELVPDGWSTEYPGSADDDPRSAQRWIKPPFGIWAILQRDDDHSPEHGPERFSLLYIGGEGVATFQALYYGNRQSPAVVAVIQPGTRFGRNWTDFEDPREIFARSVLHNPYGRPEYLLFGGSGDCNCYKRPCWPEYQIGLTKRPLDGRLRLWKRGRDSSNEPGVEAGEAAIAGGEHEGDGPGPAPGQVHRIDGQADVGQLPGATTRRKEAVASISERFRITHQGLCEVQRLDDGQLLDAEIWFGTIVTGRSQMYDCHQVALRFDNEGFVGRDRGRFSERERMQAALDQVGEQCRRRGFQLRVAGVPGWGCDTDSNIMSRLIRMNDDAARASLLMVELGIGHLKTESVAHLYRVGVTLGRPHYPEHGSAIAIEVGSNIARRNAPSPYPEGDATEVLDALLALFPHSCSSGLSRVVRFDKPEDYLSFSRHLSLAMLAGYYAERSLGEPCSWTQSTPGA